ncbi:hypothetical protein RB213_014556 [Colletotrichum asianum]|uniref:Uncharacterized protein n=1 Tax=Colletotrichum asianum TaxID=702518 RepID=A0A8H3ZI03_9PEZI|nr:hypothetical protein GQ607_016129 [Colletotrichum asianum]
MPAGPSLISDPTSTELQVYRVRTRRHSLYAAKGGSLAALLCYRGGYLSYRLPWSRGVVHWLVERLGACVLLCCWCGAGKHPNPAGIAWPHARRSIHIQKYVRAEFAYK